MNHSEKKIIAIMGPTASGKTDLAVALLPHIPADIVSVDSALVYRGMDIGTGKPNDSVLKMAPHRLINLCDPAQPYSAGQFCVDAEREIKAIFSANRVPLLVGGTMLYFQKLLLGIAELPQANQTIRDQLTYEAEKIGWSAMHEKLRRIDPLAAEKIKPQDPQRISRALEVFLITGKPISELQKNTAPSPFTNHEIISIALIPENRAWLHDRIEKRFLQMLDDGLIDEVRALQNRGDLSSHSTAMRIVGYRQVWEYLEGKTDFETMKAKAIAATRQLAKRQMTWLRSWPGLTVFDPQDPALVEKVLQCFG